MKKLLISSDLTLPLDFVTQTAAVVAKRRAGKSYLSRRIAEQLFKAAQQVVIVDPKGDWWGIRSAADGKSPGLPIVILGGERADVPLEVGAGEVVAKLVVEERVSALLDLSLLRKHEVATFMTAFLEALYRLKAREQFRTPLMLIIDEADAVAPQKPMTGEERMLGAAEDIVRRGGQRGLGCTLITQRTAVLNKNVLTQAQVLIALRTIAPQDLKAMNAWIDVHGTDEERATLMASLPSLPIGDAWFWSPGWPTGDGIFERVHVLPIETFDSGATPKPGEKRREPKQLADVDLEALRKQMSATLARAKATDPKELQKKVMSLERELATAKKAAFVPAPSKQSPRDGERKRVTALTKAIEEAMKFIIRVDAHQLLSRTDLVDEEKLRAAIESAVTHATRSIEGKIETRNREIERLKRDAASLLKRLKAVAGEDVEVDVSVRANEPFTVSERPAAKVPVSRPRALDATAADGAPTGSIRKIMVALAQHQEGLDYRRIGAFAGVSVKGGSFASWLSKARGAGWIVGNNEQGVQITDAGLAALGDYDPLPTGSDLVDFWIREIGGTPARILREIVAVYPDSLTQDEVGQRVGVSTKGGSFASWLSKLRSRDLIAGSRELRAADMFFQ